MSDLQVILSRTGSGLDERLTVSALPKDALTSDVVDLLEDAIWWLKPNPDGICIQCGKGA